MNAASVIDADEETARLRDRVRELELRVRKAEERRRALIHIMGDLSRLNKRLADQRKAMLHILLDYEHDRRRLAQSNLRLENSRKAMIHIMSDLHETTAEVKAREQELRNKQEQLIQAGKLATLGELTTGIAHELNNPLNNIGLFVGNAIDRVELGLGGTAQIVGELQKAMEQVRKATEIISHLRTFGRAAPVSREAVAIGAVIRRAVSLMQQQLRLRNLEVVFDLEDDERLVVANSIQLEQVFINLLSNARDAVADSGRKVITLASRASGPMIEVTVADSGPGIPEPLLPRVFDPFFTTKDVGAGTGLGLSISYGIIQDHGGAISVANDPGGGAVFRVRLPVITGAARPAA